MRRSCRPPSTTSSRRPGSPPASGSNCSARKSSSSADVDWAGDFHEGFTIAVPKALELPGLEGIILKNRLVFDGTAGDGTFITTPSTCLGEAAPGPSGSIYSTYLLAASYAEEESPGYQFPRDAEPRFESPIPPGNLAERMRHDPLRPGARGRPRHRHRPTRPPGRRSTSTVPHILGGGKQDSSDTRTATVSLPVGMGLNPSAANGLQTCTRRPVPPAQPGARDRLPAGLEGRHGRRSNRRRCRKAALTGNVYVGQQLSRDPASGQEYRIFVDAESARYGVSVRLLGNVSADPRTGQLTTTFADNPQVPFTSFKLSFDAGAARRPQQPAGLLQQRRFAADALVGQRRRRRRRARSS